MGLDAFVRCRCFEEGKCKPAPVPHDDLLIVKEEGYIDSRIYTKACEELGWSEADRLYGEIERAVFEWRKNACEHENMEYASEYVGNWGGMGRLHACIKDAGEERFPLLLEMTSAGNGGFFPAENAKAALSEIAELENVIEDLHEYSLYTVKTDDWTGYSSEQNWHVAPHSSFGETVAAEFIVEANGKTFHARRFKQERTRELNSRFKREVLLKRLDYETGEEDGEAIVIDYSVDPFYKGDTEFIIKEEDDVREFVSWKLDILKRLLNASLETGNPINWC